MNACFAYASSRCPSRPQFASPSVLPRDQRGVDASSSANLHRPNTGLPHPLSTPSFFPSIQISSGGAEFVAVCSLQEAFTDGATLFKAKDRMLPRPLIITTDHHDINSGLSSHPDRKCAAIAASGNPSAGFSCAASGLSQPSSPSTDIGVRRRCQASQTLFVSVSQNLNGPVKERGIYTAA